MDRSLRSDRPGHGEHAEAAEPCASLRHRQLRPRYVLARHLGHPHRSADGARSGVIFPFIIGTVIGSIAGLYRRRVSMRSSCASSMSSSPFRSSCCMLAIIAILGPGIGSFYIAMALVGWVSYARLIRSQTLVLKHSDFVIAAKKPGLQPWSHHVPPHPAQRACRLDRVLHVGCGAGDPVRARR